MDLERSVIAGVIVDPDKLPAVVRRGLRDRIEGIYSKLEDRYEGLSPIEVRKSDHSKWKFYADAPDVAFTAAVHLHAGLLAQHDIRSRMVVGIGLADSGVPADLLQDDELLTVIATNEMDPLAYLALDQMADMASHLAQSWTDGQAAAVFLRLLHPDATQKQLGEEWPGQPISQPAVSQFLDAAEWELLERTLARCRDLW